jgi:hypothetical protein
MTREARVAEHEVVEVIISEPMFARPLERRFAAADDPGGRALIEEVPDLHVEVQIQ